MPTSKDAGLTPTAEGISNISQFSGHPRILHTTMAILAARAPSESTGGSTAHEGQNLPVPISVYVTLDLEVYELLLRSDDPSDAKTPVLSSQASLVLIYRPTERMKG
ncbi:hypothetical protein TNCV_4502691 [Trichonephila clavipes]|nr:hypothetical protein TNCV_4502691 [Trichonephila clavipes]